MKAESKEVSNMANDTISRVSLEVTDGLGMVISTDAFLYVDSTKTVADVLEDAQGLALAVDNASDGKVTKATVSLLFMPTGVKTDPVSTSRIEQQGVLNYHLTGSTRVEPFSIPALAQDTLSGDKIDLTNAAIAALMAFFGTAGSSGAWVNVFRITMTTLRDAFLAYRKRRRKLHSMSYEVSD
jgi:hypothetical protein